MVRGKATIVNKLGLHARAAAKLVNLAAAFESEVALCYQDTRIDGKSIMGIMMLAAAKGSEIDIEITGNDADEALQSIMNLISNKFGEDE